MIGRASSARCYYGLASPGVWCLGLTFMGVFLFVGLTGFSYTTNGKIAPLILRAVHHHAYGEIILIPTNRSLESGIRIYYNSDV